ncbi:cysteine hydrolase family protein [Methylotenera sp.]|uniref:cysteine hydrolase family protein n=1 Tax=Methylotenera sp. TaxID=2051956 RepID=UPI002722185C|nr:cysteine hydrolase family protein [Methylotenera sp.]MDO9394008.1 cysteine hydrolase family protein [Methylotenera sp.]MDP2071432.1 cysteine hydrolase family protein [Methylotenera sp.]MDP2230408.1 cysteine hydrolase family protein [Methylotenera sp.]MDP3005393.1 cysteine hydrolase family protein [Methylotenera sp.]MDP3141487.1 cysteine hydrolase family protein [Methylotenera sp.]
MATASQTLRDITGMGYHPASLKDSALILIDIQNTYRQGLMQLTNVEPAIIEAQKLLKIARELKIPVIHIQHDAGVGTPYDVSAEIGAIAHEVAPIAGEKVIIKNYPNAFIQTSLDADLKALGIQNIVLAGFMTHMCVNSTAHGAFNLGYAATIIASATATRPLMSTNGRVLSAEEVHLGALASTRDLYAVVLDDIDALLNQPK